MSVGATPRIKWDNIHEHNYTVLRLGRLRIRVFVFGFWGALVWCISLVGQAHITACSPRPDTGHHLRVRAVQVACDVARFDSGHVAVHPCPIHIVR